MEFLCRITRDILRYLLSLAKLLVSCSVLCMRLFFILARCIQGVITLVYAECLMMMMIVLLLVFSRRRHSIQISDSR